MSPPIGQAWWDDRWLTAAGGLKGPDFRPAEAKGREARGRSERHPPLGPGGARQAVRGLGVVLTWPGAWALPSALEARGAQLRVLGNTEQHQPVSQGTSQKAGGQPKPHLSGSSGVRSGPGLQFLGTCTALPASGPRGFCAGEASPWEARPQPPTPTACPAELPTPSPSTLCFSSCL